MPLSLPRALPRSTSRLLADTGSPGIARALVLAAAALLATAGCGETLADPRFPDVPIERFGRLDDGLYRGAQPDAEGFRALKDMGVRTVVNLRGEDNDTAILPEGLHVVHLQAHITKPRDDEIKAFFDLVLDPARRPVFIHCAEGRERAGFYSALYRIEAEGWTGAQALDEMRAFGFLDVDHPEVVAFIGAYRSRGFVTAIADDVPVPHTISER